MTQPKNSDTSAKRKVSEMISEMAAGFLGLGDTIEERQNRLNAACTAWNLACRSPEVRQRQLEQYSESYLRFNPGTSPADLANIIKDRVRSQKAVTKKEMSVKISELAEAKHLR